MLDCGMKVFAYLRVSGKGQLEGDGFDRQRAAIQAFCDFKGWKVLRWFEEKGVSGTNEMGDRPALTELVGLMGPGTTDTFVVETADRLARDLMVSELILADVRKLNGKVFDAASQLDLTSCADPTRTLIRQVLGAVSQWDKSMLVKKLRAARDRKSGALGRRIEGPVPFEKRSETNATAAQWIFQMHETGKTFREIAAFLTQQKVATPEGKTYWLASSVHAIYERHSRRFRRAEPIRVNPAMVDQVGHVLPQPTV